MALWAVRRSGLGQYLKPGYNILQRFQRGAEPDDDIDCFMVVNSFKKLADAKKAAAKVEGIVEIKEHKIKK